METENVLTLHGSRIEVINLLSVTDRFTEFSVCSIDIAGKRCISAISCLMNGIRIILFSRIVNLSRPEDLEDKFETIVFCLNEDVKIRSGIDLVVMNWGDGGHKFSPARFVEIEDIGERARIRSAQIIFNGGIEDGVHLTSISWGGTRGNFAVRTSSDIPEFYVDASA